MFLSNPLKQAISNSFYGYQNSSLNFVVQLYLALVYLFWEAQLNYYGEGIVGNLIISQILSVRFFLNAKVN